MYILRKLCIHVETRRPCNFYLESSVSGLIRTVIDDSSSNGLFSSIQLELSDFLILFNLFSFTVCVFFRKKSFDFLCEFILFGAQPHPSLIGRSSRARCGVDSIRRLQEGRAQVHLPPLEILWSVPFHRFRFSMAAAAQLHGSAATAAAYRRTRAYSVPSSCRALWSPLVGYPKV